MASSPIPAASDPAFLGADLVDISAIEGKAADANEGTPRGKESVASSFREFGAGRSVLLDKNNKLIAGNHAAEAFRHAGGTKVAVVDTEGDVLVAVRRLDMDLGDGGGRAQAAALADNRTSELNLLWDSDAVSELAGRLDLGAFFSDEEIAALSFDGEGSLPGNADIDEAALAAPRHQCPECGHEF